MEFRTVIPLQMSPARICRFKVSGESHELTATVSGFWITTRRRGTASRVAHCPRQMVQGFRIAGHRRRASSRVALRLFKHFRPVDSTSREGSAAPSDQRFGIPTASVFPASNEGITSHGCQPLLILATSRQHRSTSAVASH